MNFNDYMIEKVNCILKEQGKNFEDLSDDIGVDKELMKRILDREIIAKSELLISILRALNMDIKEFSKEFKVEEHLEIRLNGELKNRSSNRSFQNILFAIEDYVNIKENEDYL